MPQWEINQQKHDFGINFANFAVDLRVNNSMYHSIWGGIVVRLILFWRKFPLPTRKNSKSEKK
jgi:hypothetical protein